MELFELLDKISKYVGGVVACIIALTVDIGAGYACQIKNMS